LHPAVRQDVGEPVVRVARPAHPPHGGEREGGRGAGGGARQRPGPGGREAHPDVAAPGQSVRGEAWARIAATGSTRPLAEDPHEGAETLGADTAAGARIAETAEFFQFLHGELLQIMDRWREHKAATG
ncbi:hypothetical protein ACE14D_12230, partial [Streptomyces sp. Act-28]